MPRVFIPRIVTEDNALGGSKIEKSLRFNGDDTYLYTYKDDDNDVNENYDVGVMYNTS